MSKKFTLQYVLDYVKQNHPKGEVLSTEYINNRTIMVFKCENGHVFDKRSYCIINRRTWCSVCSSIKSGIERRYTIAEIKESLEHKHNGCKLNNAEYTVNGYYLDITCKFNHNSKMLYRDILSGHWCFNCRDLKNKEIWLKKYGVDHPSKDREIALKTAKNSKKSTIKIHWKTSEELICTASYEPKVVDYLNTNKINFLWQPKMFEMPNGKRYLPDFFLIEENKWVEIKGYMRPHSQMKWDWFKSVYPTAELWDKKKLKSMGLL